MDTARKITDMLAVVKRHSNGPVADSMREWGVHYEVNYGVSTPTLRQIAEQFSPDHELAHAIFHKDVRELKLLAFLVADPKQVNMNETEFWKRGITNPELAENLAMNLLGWSDVAYEVLLSWALSEDPMAVYAAMLTGNRALIASDKAPDWDWDAVAGRILHALEGDSRIVWRGACSLMSRILQKAPGQEYKIKKVIADAEDKKLPCTAYLREELTWELNRKPEEL